MTASIGAKQREVKAARDFCAPIDSPISIGIDPARVYFFYATDKRIRRS